MSNLAYHHAGCILDYSSDSDSFPSDKIVPSTNVVGSASESELELNSSSSSFEASLAALRITQRKFESSIPLEANRCNEATRTGNSQAASDDETNAETADSAWTYDDSRNELYFSSHDNSVAWPEFRIPRSIYRKLFGYQKVGVQWMAKLHSLKVGGLLGDSMGMGKTFMTLAFLGGLMRAGTIRKALIVAPVSVLRSWQKEANDVLKECKRSANIHVLPSSTSKSKRLQIINEAHLRRHSSPTVIITTYGLIRQDPLAFIDNDKISWDYVVLDEGHQIKNHNAEVSRAIRRICRNGNTHRLMLTGTPIMNNLKELWSLFNWATSGKLLGTLKSFTTYFSKPIEAARDVHASQHVLALGERVNKELQDRLKPHFLQRSKVDFLSDKLPPKTDIVVWTHLSPMQRSIYEDFVRTGSKVRSVLAGETKSPLEAITWLKKLCGHPSLVNHANEDVKSALRKLDEEKLVQRSAKLSVLRHLVETLRAKGHRMLIFSQSTKMLDIIQKTLCHVCVGRIDGNTAERERQRLVDLFNDEDSGLEAMLLSTKAAGFGLTLVGADRVVVYDPSWNPAEDAQAIDRCHRIGQKREVLVYRLITAGTVEEKMYEKQIHKDGIRRTVVTHGIYVQRYFDSNELRKLFELSDRGLCDTIDRLKEEFPSFFGRALKRHSEILALKEVVGITPHDGFYLSKDDDEAIPKFLFDGKPPPPKAMGRAQRVLNKVNEIEIEPRTKDTKRSKQALLNKVTNVVAPLSVTVYAINAPFAKEKVCFPLVIRESPDSESPKSSSSPIERHRAGERTSHQIGYCSQLSAGELDRMDDEVHKESHGSFAEKVQDVLARVNVLIANKKFRCALQQLLNLLERSNEHIKGNQKLELHKRISQVADSLGLLN